MAILKQYGILDIVRSIAIRNYNSSTQTWTYTGRIEVLVNTLTPLFDFNTQNITASLDATGNATITPQQIDYGSTAINGIASLTLDKDTFDCNDVNLSNAQRALSFQPVRTGSELRKRI